MLFLIHKDWLMCVSWVTLSTQWVYAHDCAVMLFTCLPLLQAINSLEAGSIPIHCPASCVGTLPKQNEWAKQFYWITQGNISPLLTYMPDISLIIYLILKQLNEVDIVSTSQIKKLRHRFWITCPRSYRHLVKIWTQANRLQNPHSLQHTIVSVRVWPLYILVFRE